MRRGESGLFCGWRRIAVESGVVMAVLVGIGAPGVAWSQSAVWQPQGATTGSIYYNGGNVGIGVASPYSVLDISGWNGLRVSGGNSTSMQMQGDTRYHWAWNSIFSTSNGGMAIQAQWSAGAKNLALQPDSGNVGIGTVNPQYKLAVNGTIGAKDVIVTNTGWADYVFRPGYELRPLSEVRAYIEAHGHLPEIPSEAEVREKGVSVGEMQAKLLAKVEELTLHLMRQERENRELRERLERLEGRVGGEGGRRAER